MDLNLEFSFDEKTYRKRINGFDVVGHSHNLICQVAILAEEYNEFGGIGILTGSIEDAVRPIFDDYVKRNNLEPGQPRLDMGAKFYETMGMGQLEGSGSADTGEVTLTRSHLDEGWKMNFGNADHPINYWTCGFIAAMFGCAFDKPARTYKVEETASLAMGNPKGTFAVTAA